MATTTREIQKAFHCEDGKVFHKHKAVGVCRQTPWGARAEVNMGRFRLISLGDDLEECSALLHRSFTGLQDDE